MFINNFIPCGNSNQLFPTNLHLSYLLVNTSAILGYKEIHLLLWFMEVFDAYEIWSIESISCYEKYFAQFFWTVHPKRMSQILQIYYLLHACNNILKGQSKSFFYWIYCILLANPSVTLFIFNWDSLNTKHTLQDMGLQEKE